MYVLIIECSIGVGHYLSILEHHRSTEQTSEQAKKHHLAEYYEQEQPNTI